MPLTWHLLSEFLGFFPGFAFGFHLLLLLLSALQLPPFTDLLTRCYSREQSHICSTDSSNTSNLVCTRFHHTVFKIFEKWKWKPGSNGIFQGSKAQRQTKSYLIIPEQKWYCALYNWCKEKNLFYLYSHYMAFSEYFMYMYVYSAWYGLLQFLKICF